MSGDHERGIERISRYGEAIGDVTRPGELIAAVILAPVTAEDFDTTVLVLGASEESASWFGPAVVAEAMHRAATDMFEDHHGGVCARHAQQRTDVVDALGAVMDWLEKNTPALPAYEAPPAGDPIADLLAKERARVCAEIWAMMGNAVIPR